MRKFIYLSILFVFMTISACSDDEGFVEIPEVAEEIVYIPDAKFKSYLLKVADSNDDGEVSYSEAEKLTFIDIKSTVTQELIISDVTGLEAFVNINYFIIGQNNDIPIIDFTHNTKLEVINISKNNIKKVIVPTLPELWEFHCDTNELEELDLSGCPKVKEIFVSYNKLTKLNIDGLTVLDRIWFHNNKQLTNVDLSTNINLRVIDAHYNNLLELDVSNQKTLEGLTCAGNENLQNICVWDVNYASHSNYFIKDDNQVWIEDCK